MDYKTSGTVCIVPMSATDVKINGRRGAPHNIMAINGQTSCEIIEPQDNYFAIINLAPVVSDRGWLEVKDRTQVFQVERRSDMTALQSVVKEIFLFASSTPQLALDRTTQRQAEDSLLSLLDETLNFSQIATEPRLFDRYARLVRRMDEFLVLQTSSDIYADDVAKACGVSPKTLQSATKAIRGMSVYRYLRLRRLWAVRRALALGRPHQKISGIARANGFWHMGEFATSYRRHFGETPSETYARNR